eukprot:6182259-Pleurochrysis_carterae.AAC.1
MRGDTFRYATIDLFRAILGFPPIPTSPLCFILCTKILKRSKHIQSEYLNLAQSSTPHTARTGSSTLGRSPLPGPRPCVREC